MNSRNFTLSTKLMYFRQLILILVGVVTAGASFAQPYQIMKSPGNALFLDGTDDFVSMPASTKADIDTGTVECWVRRTALTGQNVTLVSKRNASNTRYSFHMGDNLLGIFNGASWSPLILSSSFVINKWYHVAFVCRLDSTLIYLNGVYRGIVNGGVGTTTGLPLQIGTSNASAFGGEFLNGAIGGWFAFINSHRIMVRC